MEMKWATRLVLGQVVFTVAGCRAGSRRLMVKPEAGVSDAIGSEPPRPTVLVLSPLPGTVSRALLLVPRSDSTDADADADGSDDPQTDHEAALGLPKGVAGLAGLSSPPSAAPSPRPRRGRSRPGC